MIDDKNPRRINPKGIGLIYIYIYVIRVFTFSISYDICSKIYVHLYIYIHILCCINILCILYIILFIMYHKCCNIYDLPHHFEGIKALGPGTLNPKS